MTDLKVIHAYRHLYRGLLHAVQFSQPARFVARDRLRAAFRGEGGRLDTRSIIRTIRFLEAATRTRGIEHSILRNLLLVSFYRYHDTQKSWRFVKHNMKKQPMKTVEEHIEKTAYKHYDMTVAMLNKSMGLCLR
ncbi:hypothetical protein AAE478_005445 [Parahypoxylon ruwenzoriense]